ncbi:hypothetical protein N9L68_04545 [bacterium]|nr:hypothetical protein [bacterium]
MSRINDVIGSLSVWYGRRPVTYVSSSTRITQIITHGLHLHCLAPTPLMPAQGTTMSTKEKLSTKRKLSTPRHRQLSADPAANRQVSADPDAAMQDMEIETDGDGHGDL